MYKKKEKKKKWKKREMYNSEVYTNLRCTAEIRFKKLGTVARSEFDRHKLYRAAKKLDFFTHTIGRVNSL